jgi:ATP-dependent Clp protease protease subunit
MSTEEVQRTPEEIAANVAKLTAEAAQANANAVKAGAEASKAEAEASTAILDLEKKRHELAKWRAGTEHHRVYRFTDSVSAASAEKCLSQLTTWQRIDEAEGERRPMEVVFTSPGGSIYDGFVLFDAIQDLRRDGWVVDTGTYGMAASMAGVLLQAGDTRWVAQSAWVLIHRASFGAAGSTDDIEDMVERVEGLERRIIDIFVQRATNTDAAKPISAAMIKRNWKRRDWWIDAETSLKLGIVDEVRGGLFLP